MQIIGAILVLLGAWLFLAVPVALLMGRFLRAGAGKTTTEARHFVGRARNSWYRTA